MSPFSKYTFYTDPAFYLFAVGSFLAIRSVIGNSEAMVALLLFYWLENVVMGCLAVLKMSMAKKPLLPGKPGMTAGDFARFSGLFMLLHGGALFMVISQLYDVDITQLTIPNPLLVGFALILGRYIIDIARFFLKKEYVSITPAEAQGFVFLRIIVFHVSSVFGLIFRFIPFAGIFLPLKIIAEFLEFLVGRVTPQEQV
jgi:hypothetical protein